MNRWLTLPSLCVFLICGQTGWAENPVFNDGDEANSCWFIGYDKQNGNGNKRGV